MIQHLDGVLHQPIRTRIMAVLATQSECDYSSLKKILGLGDGHLSTHLSVLMQSGYLESRKEFLQNKPKTTYCISELGRDRFLDYVKSLEVLISCTTIVDVGV